MQRGHQRHHPLADAARLIEHDRRVHPCHREEPFQRLRHFVFAFHDSTFECVAEGSRVTLFRGSLDGAFAVMSRVLRERQ